MYINYLDLFSISFVPDNGKISAFLKEEFKDSISEKRNNRLTIDLSFQEESREASDYILRDPVSYDSQGVYIFDKENKKVRIDFLTLGEKHSRISCDPNFHPPFFAILIDFLVSIYASKKDKILIHSSSFIYKGNVILCPAWRNVGKTNSLLNFMSEGAEYLADDWCLINDQGLIESIPKSICLFDYNLSAFPNLASRIEPSLIPLIEFFDMTIEGKIEINKAADQDIRKNMVLRVNPRELFPTQVSEVSRKVNFVFHLKKDLNSLNKSPKCISLDTEDLVRKTYEILRLEQSPFRLAYAVYKARTGTENFFIEKKKELFFNVARSAFKSSDNYQISVMRQEETEQVKSQILKKLEPNNAVFSL